MQETASGSTASQLASILAYTPDAKPSKMSLGAGVITQNTFDPAYGYRLSSIQTTAVNGTKIQDLSYTYDNEDQIAQLIESAPHAGARKVNYTYDPIGRLTQAQYSTLSNAPLITENFQSDAIGNLTS
ncbi:MAG: hypothetical protein ACOYN2_03890 [Patescibacteria group bacterium]